MGNAREGQHRSEICKGVDNTLREREAHGSISIDQFPIFAKIVSAVWFSAQDLGPVVENVFP